MRFHYCPISFPNAELKMALRWIASLPIPADHWKPQTDASWRCVFVCVCMGVCMCVYGRVCVCVCYLPYLPNIMNRVLETGRKVNKSSCLSHIHTSLKGDWEAELPWVSSPNDIWQCTLPLLNDWADYIIQISPSPQCSYRLLNACLFESQQVCQHCQNWIELPMFRIPDNQSIVNQPWLCFMSLTDPTT